MQLPVANSEFDASVSSQAHTERADLERERGELATQPKADEDELTAIYVGRGLEPDIAGQVARQLMAKGALVAHARDELVLTEEQAARPLQARTRIGGDIFCWRSDTDPHDRRRTTSTSAAADVCVCRKPR